MAWYIYRRKGMEIRLTNPSLFRRVLVKAKGYRLVYREMVA